MIKSKEEQARINSVLKQLYGDDVLKSLDPTEYEKLDEYFEDVKTSEKVIEHRKPEKYTDNVDIIDDKRNEVIRDKTCAKCNKQEVFFTGKDMFHIIKHNVCEKCYFKYVQ